MRRSFWQGAILESKTGNFSFWLGKRHVVGISGPAARRVFYDNPDMELVSGATLVPFGPHFMPPVHVIFKPSPQLGRNTSWMLHRLKASLKTDALERRLPSLLSDTRKDFAALTENNPSGVTYCPGIWKLVLKHNSRLMFTDDIVDNTTQWNRWVGLMDTALHTASIFNVAFPWLPAPEYLKRRLMRWGLQRITAEEIDKRMLPGAERKDDPLQMLVDNTDRKEFMVEYFFSTVFISSANTHAVAAQLLNIMAIHTEWQDKIFAEVKAAAETHSRRKHASLVEQLDMMPLSAWETSFPSMDLCMKEVVRMWLSISAARRNIGKDPIPIPGSNEVIPPNTFAIYNTTEVHFSDKLYPDPTKFDPTRHIEGREEYKQEMYGCKSDQGSHALIEMLTTFTDRSWMGPRAEDLSRPKMGQAADGHYRRLCVGDVQVVALLQGRSTRYTSKASQSVGHCQSAVAPSFLLQAGASRGSLRSSQDSHLVYRLAVPAVVDHVDTCHLLLVFQS